MPASGPKRQPACPQPPVWQAQLRQFQHSGQIWAGFSELAAGAPATTSITTSDEAAERVASRVKRPYALASERPTTWR